MTRREIVNNFKILFAAHHFVFVSKDMDEIASVVNVSRRRLEKLMNADEFFEALSFWRYKPVVGDIDLAEKIWIEMILNGEHLNPVEYPDEPFKCPQNSRFSKVGVLIYSHLSCVDNLSGDEIRAKLAEDGNPVPYEEGQHIGGYHWFAYPNAAEGLYSKVLARVNVVGELVIDFGDEGNETCFVCILHGRLTITRQVSVDAVNVLDKRLLICL